MTNVIYFSTQWCLPCKTLKPIVQQASQETGKHVQFVDAEQNKDLAEQYGVRSVPTIVVVNDAGQVVNRLIGIQSKSTITNLLSIC